MTRLFLALAAVAGMYGAPALTLRPVKPLFAAGEGVRLLVHVRVAAAGRMEPVELNRSATRIHLRGPGGKEVVLSGADHLRLFPAKAMAGLGAPFAVRAGQEWDAELDLLQYARPLAAGKYTAEVEYDGARSGLASFSIAPGAVTEARWTWFGGAAAKAELGGMYVAGGTWFHTARAGHDLSVVLFSVPVMTGRAGVPRLAVFPGIAGMRAERMAVWTEGSRFCWMGVTSSGATGAARCLESGLGVIRIAEPALQTVEGELRAVVFAGDRMAEVRVPFGGAGRIVPLPAGKGVRDVAVSWGTPPTVLLVEGDYLTAGGARLGALTGEWMGFVAEEWNGVSEITAATRTGGLRWTNARPDSAVPVTGVTMPSAFRVGTGTWRIVPAMATGLAVERQVTRFR